MNTIKLATIGSGSIVHSILDSVTRTDSIQCEAVYSRSLEKGKALADEYHIKTVYTNLEDMLDNPEINVVYIASPNSLHYEQTKAALEAGKNVLCEKPFCTKASQARELVSIAKKHHLFLIEAVPTSYLPNYRILKEQLPKIGRIRLVHCNYTQYSSRYDQLLAGNVTNVFDPAFAGGCLQDINYYNVYLNILLFGKPQQLHYYANISNNGADTSGILTMRYPDFVSTNIGSKDAHGLNMVQIEGEKGYLYVKNGSNGLEELRVVTKTSDETFNAQPDPSRWFYEIQQLTALLLADDYDTIYSNLETTVDVVETVEKARMDAGIYFPGDQR